MQLRLSFPPDVRVCPTRGPMRAAGQQRSLGAGTGLIPNQGFLTRVAVAVLLVCAALAALPAEALAESVRVYWDSNYESDLAGYAVSYVGLDSDHTGVLLTTAPLAVVSGLRAGQRYRFAVRAFNTHGLLSEPSNQIEATADAPDEETPATKLQFPGTDLYAAEGAAGLFSYRLALLNTLSSDMGVSITFLREGDSPVDRHYIIPAHERLTVSASDVPELNGTSFGAIVSSRPGLIAERTMGWAMGGAMAGAHTTKVITEPSRTWYLAEGNAGFFDTYVLLVNPNDAPTNVRVDFMLEEGEVVTKRYDVGGLQRLTIRAIDLPELLDKSFGTRVEATHPILVERSMYFRNGLPMFAAGHASAGVSAGSTSWFLAEGQTGSFFDTFVLLANPNPVAVDVTVRYLTENGVARTEQRIIPPTSRLTIVADSIPEIAAADVSFAITSSSPIVVERSMYWPNTPGPWHGAHNSVGLTELGVEWALAEGEVGGRLGAESYILLANPGSSAADVTLTFYREGGRPPLTLRRTVAAGARVTVPASGSGLTSGERFGAVITSTRPIAVERSIYWNEGGTWGSGTNETGTWIR